MLLLYLWGGSKSTWNFGVWIIKKQLEDIWVQNTLLIIIQIKISSKF